MKKYDHKEVEPKYQAEWSAYASDEASSDKAKNGIYRTEDFGDKPKFYCLDMFPYPSGEGLHVGHPRGYIATDVYSRFKRMQGFNVLHPMGWDAFGLPAENYAIKNKVHPRAAVEKNISRYKDQLQKIGLSYDWNREVNTTDPKFYKWTQWIFLKMFEKGLAYESFEPINWCPSCQTGLANEDLEDGKCERCGSIVEKKPMRQWVLKITNYADRLLDDLNLPELNWPEHIKELQRNWIGRSEGSEIDFAVKDSNEKVTVFTTRPDTLFGVTYVVLAPEHWLVSALKNQITNWSEAETYITEIKNKPEIERLAEGKEKTGVELNGIKAINPANNEEIPVFISDYVLASYGTGAVMAVPAHDERDFEFAKKFGLEIRQVIEPDFIDGGDDLPREGIPFVRRENILSIVKHWNEDKYIRLFWKKEGWRNFVVGGLEDGEDPIECAVREIKEETGYQNPKFIRQIGGTINNKYFAPHKNQNRDAHYQAFYFELTDDKQLAINQEESAMFDVVWQSKEEINDSVSSDVLSGKYYWDLFLNGEKSFGGNGVLTSSSQFNGLKNEEAKAKIIEFVNGRKKVTYKLRDWVFSRQRYWGEPIPLIHCEHCGVVAVPEDQLPVTLPEVKHYEPTGTGESPLANITDWVNTNCPKCGDKKAKRETNTMPQWAGSSWYYLRYIDPQNDSVLVDSKKEKHWQPVDLYVGGVEHATRHLIYARFWHKFLFDIGVVAETEPFLRLKGVGLVNASDGRKMSKRWGNVINPDDVIENVGADTIRLYEMFMGPFDQQISWSTDNMVGCRRFLERVWDLAIKAIENSSTGSASLSKEAEIQFEKTIKKVSEDIENFSFNTAVSEMMKLVNTLSAEPAFSKENLGKFIKMLAPFAPHMTEELWRLIGEQGSIHLAKWPTYNEEIIKKAEVLIIVQVNGKVRGQLTVYPNTLKDEVVSQASLIPEIALKIKGKTIIKTVFVENRLVNFVVE